MGGYSYSGATGDKTQASYGNIDYWVVKIDAFGNKLWDRSYGAGGEDVLLAVYQTTDNGYLLGGYSSGGTGSGKAAANKSGYDYWLIKVDANGSQLWEKTYSGGSANFESLTSLQQTSDGGYILAGYSSASAGNDKTDNSFGGEDFWVVKTDQNGNKQWDRTIGGNGIDQPMSVKQAQDGGYLIGGGTYVSSGGNKSAPTKGLHDYWAVKLNSSGTKLWDKAYGNNGADVGYRLSLTSDGGFIMGGYSDSNIGVDKSSGSYGNSIDYWVIKADGSGNKQWDKTLGSTGADIGTNAFQTSDGGYIVSGYSNGNGNNDKTENRITNNVYDYWVVKLSSSSDGTAPTISSVPNTIRQDNDVNKCGALVTWTPPTATDNVGVTSFTYATSPSTGLLNGGEFPVGTTTVTYTATDAAGNTSTASFDIIIKDNQNPVFVTFPASVSVNTDLNVCGATVTWTLPTASDNCPGLTITRTGGQASGTVFPVGITTVSYQVKDAANNVTNQSFTVTVTDNELPVLTAGANITQTADAGQCGALVTVALALATDNCAVGTVTGTRSDALALNAAYPVGTTTITWNVTDINGNAADAVIQTVVVTDNVKPVITTNGDKSVNNDAGACGALVTVSASATDNCTVGTPTGVRSDALALNAAYPVGTTTITWNVTDINGNAADAVIQTVVVTNVAPIINSVTSSSALFTINTPVTLTTTYTDTNVTSATITWDDGSVETINNPTNIFNVPHTYTTAGVYTVKVRVTDACGLFAEYLFEYLVAYDPSGGFVTGGGWIDSPINAYRPDPSMIGKANFGFVSKYQKGANTPTGNTEFQFKAGNINFSSTSYQWLVVSGYKAQYKGNGTINGTGNYSFLLTAIDGAKKTPAEADRFRIKITNVTTGELVYDNQFGNPEDSDASTAIAGGSIVIHEPAKGGKRDGAPEEEIATTEIADANLSVYPNPVEDVINVKFISESDAPVGFHVFDINGRTVKSETHQANPAGDYVVPVSEQNMNTGFYFLRIAQDKATKTIKLYKK